METKSQKKKRLKNAKSDSLTSEQIINYVDYFLRVGALDQAMFVVRQVQDWNDDKETARKLIELVVKHPDHCRSANQFLCGTEIICDIATKIDGEEILAEFIALLRSSVSDLHFIRPLLPIQVSLMRVSKTRDKWLDKCIEEIIQTLIKLRPAEVNNWSFTGNNFVSVVTHVYQNLIQFYEPFLHESCSFVNSLPRQVATNQKRALAIFILQLLGRPLMFLDVSDGVNNARSTTETLIGDLSRLIGDLFHFLDFAELEELEDDSERERENVFVIAVAHLFYLLLVEGIGLDRVPCVYDPVYVWINAIYLATRLFSADDDGDHAIARKGLLLFVKVTSRFKDESISHRVLDSRVHGRFMKAVAALHCHPDLRELITDCLHLYVLKMDDRGRYLVLYNVVVHFKEPDFVAEFTTILLEIILQSLQKQTRSRYFHGPSLFRLLSCYAQIGDLDIEVAVKQIVVTLMIFRFLQTTVAGDYLDVRKYEPYFKSEFISPLSDSIVRIRVDYKRRVLDLEDVLAMASQRKTEEFPESMRRWIADGSMGRETGKMIGDLNARLERFLDLEKLLDEMLPGRIVGSALGSHDNSC